MRWLALLAVACGCNSVFSIDSTKLIDAPPSTPPIDAPPPPMCPAIGTMPRFGVDLTQVAARKCQAYNVDTKQSYAAGMCPDPSNSYVFASGPVGEPMQMQTNGTTDLLSSVSLAPEGDTAFLTLYSYTTYLYTTTEYHLVDGVWTAGAKAFTPPGASGSYTLSSPTRGPVRRMVTMLYDSTSGLPYLQELAWDGTTISEVSRVALSTLEVSTFDTPNLSPDGLRLLFTSADYSIQYGGGALTPDSLVIGPGGIYYPGYDQPVYYTDRPTINDAFRKPEIIETVPGQVSWPFMTEDCGRVYFSALNTVWYLSQPIL